MSDSMLRPSPEALGDEWRSIVVEEYEQVEAIREWHDEDYYQSISEYFAADPHRTDDEILNRLRAMSNPDATWLDIGAGGGRYTLPLALVSAKVIAVEPSGGMIATLRTGIEQYSIDNVELHQLRWPEGSERIKADYSLISHVGYDIREINLFLDGLERATREYCVCLTLDQAPSGGFVRLWEQVHGDKRQQLPAMREFLHLLLARGATPEIELFPRRFREWDEDDLRSSARRRLWLVEDSEKDQKLQQLITEELAAGVDDYQMPTMLAMVKWKPVS